MSIISGGAKSTRGGYQIARSLRFRSSASANLTKTFGGAGSTTKHTISVWVKRSGLTAYNAIISSYVNGSNETRLWFTNTAALEWYDYQGSVMKFQCVTSAVYRDPSAWLHIVCSCDTVAGTQKLYVNGVEVAYATHTPLGSSAGVLLLAAAAHQIGSVNSTQYFNGYKSEMHVVGGLALDPTAFGQANATTGAWNPIKYTGTYGTNGFYLPFSDNSAATSTTIGQDSSGNGNNWTPSGISITAGVTNDSLVDTPTNYGSDTGAGGEVRGNYATLNPIDGARTATLANGNLKATVAVSGDLVRSTFAITDSNAYYFEATFVGTGGGGNAAVGVIATTRAYVYPTSQATVPTGEWQIRDDGTTQNNGASASALGNFATGDVIGVLVVAPNIWFRKDAGTWFEGDGTARTSPSFSNLSLATWGGFVPMCNFQGTTGTPNFEFNFGQRPFKNAAPTSTAPAAKALCTQNLSDPAIVKPSLFMDVNTRTGTGAAFNVTGKGFQPDLVWMKGRSGATAHAIYDAVRTATKDLGSNLATDETTQVQGITAFNSDGFSGGTLAKINTSAATYVDWMWKKGATPGIDVVSYTGNGANRTIAHALGVVPSMMIVKSRVTAGADTGWAVYHSALANTEYLKLETTAAKATGATYWNSTTPTSSVFSLGTAADTNTNSDTYINYLFAEVAGFSKFGSYTGNASADGPFVSCGFRPKFILIKSSTAVDAWLIYDSARDTYNVMPDTLVPNTTAAEAAISGIDFLSNGFKLRTITTTPNAAQTYIFMAFAEAAGKYSRAR